jgi:hypothetical protein
MPASTGRTDHSPSCQRSGAAVERVDGFEFTASGAALQRFAHVSVTI